MKKKLENDNEALVLDTLARMKIWMELKKKNIYLLKVKKFISIS